MSCPFSGRYKEVHGQHPFAEDVSDIPVAMPAPVTGSPPASMKGCPSDHNVAEAHSEDRPVGAHNSHEVPLARDERLGGTPAGSIPFTPYEPRDSSYMAELLDIMATGHRLVHQGLPRFQALNLLLDRVVSLSGAEYGYFGKLMYNSEGKKILKILSYTNIAWTPELQDLVATVQELDFNLEGGGLFAEPCRTGQTVIANDAPNHPASKGLPEGHPPLYNFISVPILLGGRLIGTIGLANRTKGWPQRMADDLLVASSMLGGLFLLFENRQPARVSSPAHVDVSAPEPSEGQSAVLGPVPYTMGDILRVPFLESMSDGILIFDSSSLELLSCNKGAYSMLGFHTEREFLDSSTSFADLIVESNADRSIDIGLVLRMAKSIQGITLDVALRKRVSTPADSSNSEPAGYVQVEMRVTSFEVEGKDYNTAVFRDVTQDKVYKRKDELLAFLSHELRNPLQVILSGIPLLRGSNLDPSLCSDLEKASHILQAVINDTIDFVNIHSCRLEAQTTKFAVRPMIDFCLRMFDNHKTKDTVGLPAVLLDGMPVEIIGDERRMTQVLGNLVTNAFRHTTQGTVTVVAGLDEVRDPRTGQERIKIQVKDTGLGMTEEQRKKLFSFFTHFEVEGRFENDSSMARRTGLGLRLSREICRALGGELWCEESVVGVGTTFSFAIPFQRVEDRVTSPRMRLMGAEAVEESRANIRIHPSASLENLERTTDTTEIEQRLAGLDRLGVLEGKRVYFVEDNALVLMTVKRVLAKAGCVVSTAQDGQEAVTELLRPLGENGWYYESFDFILMDCLMPEKDGYEATAELRSAGVKTPIIALTGNSLQADVDRCLHVGYDAVLVKPILLPELGDLVRTFMRRGMIV